MKVWGVCLLNVYNLSQKYLISQSYDITIGNDVSNTDNKATATTVISHLKISNNGELKEI